jgi:hypothetical protein
MAKPTMSLAKFTPVIYSILNPCIALASITTVPLLVGMISTCKTLRPSIHAVLLANSNSIAEGM